MIVETRKIYTCEFCRKYYKMQHFAKLHETRCHKNPANDRKCFHCSNLELVEVDYHFDTYHGEDVRKLKVYYCEKIDTYLYPPTVEHKGGTDFDFGDKCNEPMKKECDKFNENSWYA